MSFMFGSVVCYTLITGRLYNLRGGGFGYRVDDPVAFWIFTFLHAVIWALFVWSTVKCMKTTLRLKKEVRE